MASLRSQSGTQNVASAKDECYQDDCDFRWTGFEPNAGVEVTSLVLVTDYGKKT